MRGVGQGDAIESLRLTHAVGNEGGKNVVERGNRGFFGAKLLKIREEHMPAPCPKSQKLIYFSLVSSSGSASTDLGRSDNSNCRLPGLVA
jgi:hypothetical protein